jgi:hypothetical protein
MHSLSSEFACFQLMYLSHWKAREHYLLVFWTYLLHCSLSSIAKLKCKVHNITQAEVVGCVISLNIRFLLFTGFEVSCNREIRWERYSSNIMARTVTYKIVILAEIYGIKFGKLNISESLSNISNIFVLWLFCFICSLFNDAVSNAILTERPPLVSEVSANSSLANYKPWSLVFF